MSYSGDTGILDTNNGSATTGWVDIQESTNVCFLLTRATGAHTTYVVEMEGAFDQNGAGARSFTTPFTMNGSAVLADVGCAMGKQETLFPFVRLKTKTVETAVSTVNWSIHAK